MKSKNLLYKGMRDFLPEDMLKREYVIKTVKEIFETYGFEPLKTPAIEMWETLSGKYGADEKLVYRFKDRGNRDVGLRYDLTVPLARAYSTHRDKIIKPFKRYQIQPVWRADKPQKGRFREFYQCDVDILGTKSLYADAELIKIVFITLKKLGFKDFTIKINSRKIFPAIIDKLGENDNRIQDFARSVDKLDKIGPNGVLEDLERKNFKTNSLSFIRELLFIDKEKDNLNIIKKLNEIFSSNAKGKIFLHEIEEFYSNIIDFSVPQEFIRISPLLARGLDYYTGPIFETVVEEPRIGSISGGGRYDELIGMFSGDNVPATGVSLGLERIITVMDELSMFPFDKKTKVELLFAVQDKKFFKEIINYCEKIREEKINCDIYFGGKDLRGQIKYAISKGIRFIAIIGEDEVKEKTISIKDLRERTQKKYTLKEVIKLFKKQ